MVNRGIAFGLLAGLPWWVGFLVLLILIAVAVMPVHAGKTRELLPRFGLILMIIGGSVNTYQRITIGAVVDNLPMLGLGYNNFADYLIFFGVLIYGYGYFRTTRKLRGSEDRKNSAPE